MEDNTTTEQKPKATFETVELDEPIARGKTTIREIQVRKPKSGALRGVALTDILQMDVSALTKVLPRITEPALTEADIRGLDPADLVQLGGTVAGFLLPKKMLEGNE
ncbi:phage tail assembly protein [Halomonas binhaiensis]|uniref:phage tail assembly protein n=1 Tax=Halomonas binhaiensis TaxID=2562282 RepID=UPI001F07F5B3|nr:phage tail assembly protein [Halomonas binhaiensis]